MAYKYSVVARKNPSDPESAFKYYPHPLSSGQSGFKALAKKIQKYTGQSFADVTGVLAALEDILPEEIKAGLIIRLGGIGSFYPSYKTTGEDTPEAVSSRNIEKVSIRFRSEKNFLEQINLSAEFEKVGTTATTNDEEVPEEGEAAA